MHKSFVYFQMDNMTWIFLLFQALKQAPGGQLRSFDTFLAVWGSIEPCHKVGKRASFRLCLSQGANWGRDANNYCLFLSRSSLNHSTPHIRTNSNLIGLTFKTQQGESTFLHRYYFTTYQKNFKSCPTLKYLYYFDIRFYFDIPILL